MNNFDCMSNIRGKCKEKNMKLCKGWSNCSLAKDGRPCKGCVFSDKCDSDFFPCADCVYNKKPK